MQYSNNDDGRAFVYYPNNTTMNRHVTSMEKEDEEEMLAAVTRSNRYRTFMENFNDLKYEVLKFELDVPI